MTKTTAALLVLVTLASAACSAGATEPYPALVTESESATVTATVPAEMVGTWELATVQGSVASWTFRADRAVTHSITVISGPAACRRTVTTVYEGTIEIEDRTLAYTATRATETTTECTGTTTAPAKGYAETLTYEIVSPTELVLREVSKCPQTDRASKEAFCRTTFAKK